MLPRATVPGRSNPQHCNPGIAPNIFRNWVVSLKSWKMYKYLSLITCVLNSRPQTTNRKKITISEEKKSARILMVFGSCTMHTICLELHNLQSLPKSQWHWTAIAIGIWVSMDMAKFLFSIFFSIKLLIKSLPRLVFPKEDFLSKRKPQHMESLLLSAAFLCTNIKSDQILFAHGCPPSARAIESLFHLS